MPRLRTTLFWASMTGLIALGTLQAMFELVAGTRLDWLAIWWTNKR